MLGSENLIRKEDRNTSKRIEFRFNYIFSLSHPYLQIRISTPFQGLTKQDSIVLVIHLIPSANYLNRKHYFNTLTDIRMSHRSYIGYMMLNPTQLPPYLICLFSYSVLLFFTFNNAFSQLME